MNIFEWENGTVVERPYVEIDGVKHYLQDGTISGGTPATANNLNEMQNILNGNIKNANDTGSGYIKYPDGTMVCYGTISGDSALSEYWSNFKKTADITINFPQEFYSVPSITLTGLGYGYISTFLTSIPTLTRATCAVIKAGNSTNTDYYISYIAVGKWK